MPHPDAGLDVDGVPAFRFAADRDQGAGYLDLARVSKGSPVQRRHSSGEAPTVVEAGATE